MNKLKWFSLMLIFSVSIVLPLSAFAKTSSNSTDTNLSSSTKAKIEDFIEKQMDYGKIPGMSVAVVKGDNIIFQEGFGYSDLKSKRKVTSDTLFELASNSKAFTATGLILLEEKGLINLNDSVEKYLPWLKMKYQGKYTTVTIEQLLHHTSGIPFKTIGDIPESQEEDALEQTVRTLIGKELDSLPGERYQYATINYDIIGLIIQKVSGKPYEKYMKEDVLLPLGLNSTFLNRSETVSHDMSSGYKISYLHPVEYNAPIYRGNVPAGYIISNIKDMSRWVQLQLGVLPDIEKYSSAIIKTHTPDYTVLPSMDGSMYAMGWSVVYNKGQILMHGGNNPSYCSFIMLRPEDKIGVVILSNMASNYVDIAGRGILNIIKGENPGNKNQSGNLQNLDKISFLIICISIIFSLLTVLMLAFLIRQISKKERVYIISIRKLIITLSGIILFLGSLAYCLYRIPDIIFYGMSWGFIKVWGPASILTAVLSLFIAVFVFCIFLLLSSMFKKKDIDTMIFPTIVLSIASGLGNSLLIFIIITAINASSLNQSFYLYFILGAIIYLLGQLWVNKRLLVNTNNIIYSRRIEMINKILDADYQKIEAIKDGKIHAGLNNDTETISNFINFIVTGITNVITLLCCLIYLGFISLLGLFISVLLIVILGGLYYLAAGMANKFWKQTRDIQNIFFRFINDLIGGFKELSINKTKNNDFKKDIVEVCGEYKEKRIQGGEKFIRVFVLGQMINILAVGLIALFLPFIDIHAWGSNLRSFVFIFIYMIGPIQGIMNLIPNVVQMRISWSRINELIRELFVSKDEFSSEIEESLLLSDIELNEVEYKYEDENGIGFRVGPINVKFVSGQITFITGGNGSGKSTLAKIISGIYLPHKGNIMLNGRKIDSRVMRNYFTGVFSDYYIFSKLYGIDYSNKQEEISKYLKLLGIDDKVQIKNGMFSTLKLSTGQKKRLALLTSYLEDKQVYLFDEWAADQDIEFREFYYRVLLPGLRERGKCVIAITHDDRYFEVADKIIKMEMGVIIESNNKVKLLPNASSAIAN